MSAVSADRSITHTKEKNSGKRARGGGKFRKKELETSRLFEKCSQTKNTSFYGGTDGKGLFEYSESVSGYRGGHLSSKS
jgi:hypothetical protein